MANATFSGLFKKQLQEAFKKDIHNNIKKAVKAQFKESFRDIKKDLEVDVKIHFKVKKQSFAKAFGNKIYDSSTKKLPSMAVYAKLSKIMDGFENGVTVSAKKGFLFVPTIRIGPKTFKSILDVLHNTNSLFYVNKNGKLLCLARVTPLNKHVLGRFKSQQRKTTGQKSIRMYDEVLIATLIKKVYLKKRLSLHTILNNSVGEISEKALRRVKVVE